MFLGIVLNCIILGLSVHFSDMIQSVLQPVEFLAAVANVATILGELGMPALVLFFVAFGCESGGAI